MEHALYDAEHGFFATSPVGRAFATAPHISPVFAACIARLLERSGGDTMLELACGDGTLAEQVARSAPGLAARTRYLGIDRDRTALARFASRPDLGFAGMQLAETLEGIDPIRGLIFANELFDNVPFHRVRRRGGEIVEVFVEDGGEPREVEDAPGPGVLEAASRMPREGEEINVSPDARTLLRTMIERLDQGTIVVIDYGYAGDDEVEPVRGYREHARVDPLAAPPGSCDITGPVDVDALVSEARAAGLEVTHRRQRELLADLGYEGFLDDLDRQRRAAEERGDARRAVRIWEARRDAALLVDPSHLGDLHVLELRRGG